MRRPFAVLLMLLASLVPLAASAQGPTDDHGDPDAAAGPHEPDQPDTKRPPELPTDPADRLEMAQAAFRRADYALLVPLLEPLCGPDSPLPTVDARVQARELLVVGYFFLAQQVTTAADRDTLMQKARSAALDLLRDKPDHVLDALVFPVSVVDLFESVRRENSEELDELIAQRREGAGNSEAQTIYLERVATKHPGWVNLLPFAAGQFQNGQLVKGTTFAILEAAGLALNATSYWMILRLRDPTTGRFSSEGGLSSDLAKARRWRQALYGGLAGFAAVWVVSIIDGWLNHQSETVRIRTLDAPPPELGGDRTDAGLGFGLPLGLSVEIRW